MGRILVLILLVTVSFNVSALECITKADFKLPKAQVENFAGNFRMYAQFSNGTQIGFGLREFPVNTGDLLENEYCSLLIAYNSSNGKSNFNSKESKWIYDELDLGSINLNFQEYGIIADFKSKTNILYFDNTNTNLASNNTIVGLVCQLTNFKDSMKIISKINKTLTNQLVCK